MILQGLYLHFVPINLHFVPINLHYVQTNLHFIQINLHYVPPISPLDWILTLHPILSFQSDDLFGLYYFAYRYDFVHSGLPSIIINF